MIINVALLINGTEKQNLFVSSSMAKGINFSSFIFLENRPYAGAGHLIYSFISIPFKLTCKVKNKEKSKNGPYRAGVYFPDISESSKEKLSQCIESPD
jgi:hypothetical protein